MGYEIKFYKTESGRKPVEDFIQSLQEKQIAKILRDITLLQKKTNKTPKKELETALARMKDYKSRG